MILSAESFAPPLSFAVRETTPPRTIHSITGLSAWSPTAAVSTVTSWLAPSWPIAFKSVAFALLGVIVSVSLRRQWSSFLWPGSGRDPAIGDYPLPPGSLGCPFFGFNILKGNKRKGPEYWYFEQSAKLGHPKLWKFYFMGPVASIVGARFYKEIMSREFDVLGKLPEESKGDLQDEEESLDVPAIFGNKSVNFERDQETHQFLRRLIGAGLNGPALHEAFPVLLRNANNCIDRMKKKKGAFPMQTYCVDYTMDFVQEQLLGITDVSEHERAKLRSALETWLSALFSLASIIRIPWLLKRSKPYKARLYLQAKILERIDYLQRHGPDSSTLSNLVFAVDDESQAKLNRLQMVENALFLIAAGTETSSSSLSLALFLLGLNPATFKKLVDEQDDLRSRHGELTSARLLDAPYLDAVVKETLRLGAVSGGFPRRVRETLVIDGYQIPMDWQVFGNIRLSHQLDPVTRQNDNSHMDPRKGFKPERWLREETRPVDFIPFGAGPRYCLGANLAMLEMKVFLATFARRVPTFQLAGNKVREGIIEWHPRTIIPRPLDDTLVELPTLQ